MSRINVIDPHNANAEQKALLDAIQGQLGMVPNFLKVFANSPVALQAFLGLHGVANAGSLSPQTRERIALALAQQNTCEYCLSAHTAIGRKAGLTGDEIAAARADDTGLARKFNVTLTAACTLRDPRTGHATWTDRRISVRREVFTDSGQLQAEYQTLALLTEALAARITSDLVETW